MKTFTRTALIGFALATGLLATAAPDARGYDPRTARRVEEMRLELTRLGKTYTVGLNPAMQYSLNQICGGRLDLRQKDYQAHAEGGYLNPVVTDPDAVVLPAKYVGWFSSIKDQGQCGSCWAFSTIATVETAALVKHKAPQGKVNANGSITTSGDITVLSEQQVLSCNPFQYSCDGGWYSFDMLNPANLSQGTGYYKGAVAATAFPYVASDAVCSIPASATFTPISQWGYVDSGNGIPSVTAIKAAIYKWGAVSVAVYADQYFQAYTGGVFDGSDNKSSINHCVQLVGWDNTKGAWLLKNSWGPGWGIEGFMWIKWDVNSVGTSPAWAIQ